MTEMENTESKHTVWETVRNTFGRGLAVIVPVVITFMVLQILFNAVDCIASPFFDKIFTKHIPGIGFITMIILIFIVGALSRNLIARTAFRFFEKLIGTIPLARTIYTAMKDIIGALQPGKKGRSFRQVVAIDYPRQGLKTIGFVTNELDIQEESKTEGYISVYLPNPPNPTSGFLVLVPRSEVHVIDMSVEEGLKLVLSGGIVTSGLIKYKL
jgi:uncharacterized membrane protein